MDRRRPRTYISCESHFELLAPQCDGAPGAADVAEAVVAVVDAVVGVAFHSQASDRMY